MMTSGVLFVWLCVESVWHLWTCMIFFLGVLKMFHHFLQIHTRFCLQKIFGQNLSRPAFAPLAAAFTSASNPELPVTVTVGWWLLSSIFFFKRTWNPLMTLVLVGKDLIFGGLTFKNRGLLRVPGTYLEYGRPWRFVFGLGMGPFKIKIKIHGFHFLWIFCWDVENFIMVSGDSSKLPPPKEFCKVWWALKYQKKGWSITKTNVSPVKTWLNSMTPNYLKASLFHFSGKSLGLRHLFFRELVYAHTHTRWWMMTRWWFQIFFIFTRTWGNDQIWL